jgi:putative transposase
VKNRPLTLSTALLPTADNDGDKLKDALRQMEEWTVEIIKRSDRPQGFEILPRRCVAERMLAWLNRNRRLAKDFEQTIASATAWLFIASVQILTQRIATTCNHLA